MNKNETKTYQVTEDNKCHFKIFQVKMKSSLKF